jgi:hypothetical protein
MTGMAAAGFAVVVARSLSARQLPRLRRSRRVLPQCSELKRPDTWNEKICAALHGRKSWKALYLPSDRAPRDCEVIGAILGADEGITLIAKLVEIWVICPNVLRELELADEAGAYHERRDPTISSILKRTFQ